MSLHHSHSPKKMTALLAVVSFLPAFIIFLLWIMLGLRDGSMGRAEKTQNFLDLFPSWLQSMSLIHILGIIFCLIAIILASKSFKYNLLWIRIVLFVIVIAAIFIILFDIFQTI